MYAADGREIPTLGGQTVRAQMRFVLPAEWKAEEIFVVFRLADGSLKAFRAVYDPIRGILSFETDILGEFILVDFAYDGEPFTEEFYAALEAYLASREG